MNETNNLKKKISKCMAFMFSGLGWFKNSKMANITGAKSAKGGMLRRKTNMDIIVFFSFSIISHFHSQCKADYGKRGGKIKLK